MLAIGAARAEPGSEPASPPAPEAGARSDSDAAPAIDLDRLLTLPDSYSADGERRGGVTRGEWRQRFSEAAERLATAEEEVGRLQSKLSDAAEVGGWQAGAPGLTNPDPQNNTLHFKLRQDLRRAREELAEAKRRSLDLALQADLAAVPAEWRE
ncbi:MAG: hypothetical protein R3E88_17750 [Myxococcota bacterium]|nr:hypothetical protein [Myxococcales bacterium]